MAADPILGCIYMFAGSFNPRGFMLCQGQLLPISQNTALFSILGTTYGGDGVRTFALPDLRGRAPIQQGNGPGLPPYVLGEATGNTQVTMTTNQMPMHNHLVSASQNSDATDPSNAFPGTDSRGTPLNIYNSSTDGTKMNPLMMQPAGSGIPIPVQNPILAINYIIATQGIFPSRN